MLKPAGGCAALLTLLTACPQPPPPYVPPVVLNFRFPETAVGQNLRLAAIYFEQATPEAEPKLKVLALGSLNAGASGSVSSGTIQLFGSSSYYGGSTLDTLKNNPLCVTPFKGGETKGMTAVMVTPETVRTCNVYFTLFRDTSGDGKPTSDEELYQTHDLYSYANAAFTYQFTSLDTFSTESGTRAAGWSLVRHEVLQPSETLNRYVVSMNSVPTADQAIAIRLHESTNRLTSQGLNHAGGQK
ncbi:hypothetical protein [Deinococcus koreensis]|uniref:Lipoprotein n=1 Tax=Deinococcus koreensis TaxID=2054903 RepID=A0A2K3UYX4_9DEIO|nr:hypothetical protein [Deinococcus koreensis]PNY81730.1 hypothetical protein CVO96_10385 [Deinococcus koreensis]